MIVLAAKDKRFLGVLFLVSFLIRSLVFHFYLCPDNKYWQVDSPTYHAIAQGIASEKGISLPSGEPNFYRVPGYPLFVAFFYKVFGDNPLAALWVQVVLASCIPVLIFLLSRVLFPRRRWLAHIAGGCGAVHLGLVLYSGFFMTESLFIVLFLLFVLCFFSAVHLWFCDAKIQKGLVHECYCNPDMMAWLPDSAMSVPSFEPFHERVHSKQSKKLCSVRAVEERSGLFLLSGLFLGMASLVRPVGHYLLGVALLLVLFSRASWRARLRGMIALFIAWFFVVAFWLVRNYMLLGHVFFHTLPGGHFMYLSAARVAMYAHDCSYQQARDHLAAEVKTLMKERAEQNGKPLNEIEKCYVHETIARRYFTGYPLLTVKTWLTDITRTCLSLYSAELLYVDSGRQTIDYFAKGRGLWSCFMRYIWPQTTNWFLKAVVWLEIALFFFVLLGLLLGFMFVLCSSVVPWHDACSWWRCVPFMALFIVIALAGGYARMRLPIEPFLLILSLYFWTHYWEK